MRIAFASSGSLRDFREVPQERADVTIFGFNGVGEVNYEKELKGESTFFEEGTKLSKRDENIVIFGCVTDTRGHRRKSVAIAENGRLLGVSDMLHSIDGEYAAGANVRAYETRCGRMGVIVDRDLYFPETMRALALCGCSWIVCPFDRTVSPVDRAYLCVYAHACGVPIFLCGDGFSMIVGYKGELIFSSPCSPIFAEYDEKRVYHLVERRWARYLP